MKYSSGRMNKHMDTTNKCYSKPQGKVGIKRKTTESCQTSTQSSAGELSVHDLTLSEMSFTYSLLCKTVNLLHNSKCNGTNNRLCVYRL